MMDINQLMKRVAMRLKGDRLERCYTLWADNVYELKRQREVLQRISFRMKSRRAVASFNRWCEYIDERLYQRKLVGKVFNRLVKGQVVAAWTSWKDFVLNDSHIKAHRLYTPASSKNEN